jgi:hypothetical protein
VTCTLCRGSDESRSCWTRLLEQTLLERGKNLVADEWGDRQNVALFSSVTCTSWSCAGPSNRSKRRSSKFSDTYNALREGRGAERSGGINLALIAS